MNKFFLLAMVMLGGCATSPDKIPSQYVSPVKYKNYTEAEIIQEMKSIGEKTSELYLSLKQKASRDKWQMTVGLLLFNPVLLALEGGDGLDAQEYARLKGEYEALRKVAIQKKIKLESLPPFPEEIVQEGKIR